jgi:hypothetical protein
MGCGEPRRLAEPQQAHDALGRLRRRHVQQARAHVDVSDPAAKQYTGWPKTVKQEENYGRKATGWLPTVEVAGATDPVVRVDDEATGEMVYCIRIKGTSWRPKVFKPGRYTVTVGEGAKARKFRRVSPVPKDYRERLRVSF